MVYRHYNNGGLYRLIGKANDVLSDKKMIVIMALEDSSLWYMSPEWFYGHVTLPHSADPFVPNGVRIVPRFELVEGE